MKNIENDNYCKYIPNNLGKDLYAVVAGIQKANKTPNLNCYIVRPRFALHFILNGSGILETNGKKHEISKGQFFIVYPGTKTRIKQNELDQIEYIWIEYDGKEAKNLTNTVFSTKNPVFTTRNIGYYESFLNEMIKELHDRKSLEILALSYLSKLFSNLIEETDNFKVYESNNSTNTIEKAIRYINDNYTEQKLSLQSISDFLSITPNYFSRIFKQVIGISFSEYLSDLRLDKACQLFSSSNPVSVNTAAYSTGYRDPLYFSKIFHKKYNLSPTEYIKSHSTSKK